MRRAGIAIAMALMLAASACGGSSSSSGTPTRLSDVKKLPMTSSSAAIAELDRGLIETVGEQSGAKASLGEGAWKSFVNAYQAINVEMQKKAPTEAQVRQIPLAQKSGARSTPSQASPFDGIIESLVKTGIDFGQEVQPGQGGSVTSNTDRKVTEDIDNPDGSKSKVAITSSTHMQHSINGTTIKVDAAIEVSAIVTNADGVVTSEATAIVTGNFLVKSCPEQGGDIAADGQVEAHMTSGSSGGATTSLTVNGTGAVNDDAFLESFDWEAHGSDGSTDVSTSGSLKGASEGRFDLGGKNATVTEISSAEGDAATTLASQLGRFQTDLTEAGLNLIMEMAQGMWRGGKCVEIRTTEDSRDVDANEKVAFTATVRHLVEKTDLPIDIEPTFSGKKSANPDKGKQPTPLDMTYIAGGDSDDTGTITLVATSNRGRAEKSLTFTVRRRGWVPVVMPGAGTIRGAICDLSKPWSFELHLDDLDTIAYWLIEGTPTDSEHGTLSAIIPNALEAARVDNPETTSAEGFMTAVRYHVEHQTPDSLVIAFDDQPFGGASQQTDIGDMHSYAGGGYGTYPAGGYLLKADPNACH